MPTPDADEGTEIESSTCYNGVLSRVYNRLKVNVSQHVPKENQMEHRIKCSAWNKFLAYCIRVKLTGILFALTLQHNILLYLYNFFFKIKTVLCMVIALTPNDSKFSIFIFCRLSVDHGTCCRQRSSPFGTR